MESSSSSTAYLGETKKHLLEGVFLIGFIWQQVYLCRYLEIQPHPHPLRPQDATLIAKEIFGSNLFLSHKNVVVYPENVVDVVVKNVVVPTENVVVVRKNVDQNVVGGGIKQQWAAVKAAHALVGKMPLSCVVVDVARIELATSRM